MILNFDFDFLVELHLDDVIQVLLRNLYINTKGIFTEKNMMLDLYMYIPKTPGSDYPALIIPIVFYETFYGIYLHVM